MKSPKGVTLPSDEVSSWHDRYVDRLVGWNERRHLKSSEGIPSAEAVEEATQYYSGLYIDKAPDPIAFSRLLRRRGIPDWANPYDIADPRYHLLHSDGFLWADVQFLVEDLIQRAKPHVELPPVSEDENSQEDEGNQFIHHAQICWLMVLQETGGRWPKSLQAIHPDNLVAITLESLLNPHIEIWGLDPGKWDHPDLAG